ncbi:chloride channel protein D-like isoform X1 [Branchiostoma lanceolatum]|uniref:chloride channel protein D-like isoform X1 n=1 Tax=Branchiostoma lanceolatum TaxID=7740 RepID=UPI00345179F6
MAEVRSRRKKHAYSVSQVPSVDDVHLAQADTSEGFFARGREFESVYVNHRYTAQEREELSKFDSLDYLPSHSFAYKNWIKRQPSRLDWDRWVMMGLIGFTVGFLGFLLHQIIEIISEYKWEKAEEFIKDGDIAVAYIWVLGISLLLVIVGSVLVVYFRPSAGGSGMPELIGFLNGTVVRHIFNVKTFVVKFLSCACAVASGLPVGPEGPMIHMGGLIGAGLSQFRSGTLGFALPFFQRFRNSEDRRNFIQAGAGAGVASAFGAPVGGLLFAMEEVSSFWNMKLTWQTFFCCMIATFTTDLFNSAFTSFQYKGSFGLFRAEKYILFQVRNEIPVNILAFIPTVVLGVLGGLLGGLFTFCNLKIVRGRRAILAKLSSDWKRKVVRVSELCLIITLTVTASVFLPAAFSCSPFTCYSSQNDIVSSPECLSPENHTIHTENDVSLYTCPPGVITRFSNNSVTTNKTFNQVATLMFVTGEEAIHHLFSRETHNEFSYGPLFAVLCIYFFLACWTAGSAISSGLVVPMVLIGALYGRIIGLSMVSMFGVMDKSVNEYWAWMDPGAFALIGAASFFGGVSRLTMSLTVIMMEMTNDVQFLLPIMVSIMVAKWVGDFVTHPLYHALLELKCIPFLDSEPVIVHEGNKPVNLELHMARDVMAAPPSVISTRESVANLAHLLLDTPHGGFPVVHSSREGQEKTFYGMITRIELSVILFHPDVFETEENPTPEDPEVTLLDYQQTTIHKLYNTDEIEDLLTKFCDDPVYDQQFVNLQPYVNQSALSVRDTFSLHRTYIIFRTLGLRHLTVVDETNKVVGIITRKDLMGFHLEEALAAILLEQQEQNNIKVEMAEVTDMPNSTTA